MTAGSIRSVAGLIGTVAGGFLLSRYLNYHPREIEPEEALRKANRKFEQRFRQIEQAPGFDRMSLDEMEELWVAAKKAPAEA